MWIGLRGDGGPVELSAFAAYRLWLRSPRLTQEVGVRHFQGQANFAVTVEARPDWQEVEVPFDRLQAFPPGAAEWRPDGVAWFGVSTNGYCPDATTGDESHPAEIEIDRPALVLAGAAASAAMQVDELAAMPAGLAWTPLVEDAEGDGLRPRLPDKGAPCASSATTRRQLWPQRQAPAPAALHRHDDPDPTCHSPTSCPRLLSGSGPSRPHPPKPASDRSSASAQTDSGPL